MKSFRDVMRWYSIIIAFAISMPLVIFGYHDIQEQQKAMQLQMRQELLDISLEVEQRIAYSLDDIERIVSDPTFQRAQKIYQISQVYQPVVDYYSIRHPGYGIGIYVRDLSSIVAMTGKNFSDYKDYRADPRMLASYETGRYEFFFLDSSFIWNGAPIVALTYPLYSRGQIIGHIAATTTVENFNHLILLESSGRVLFILLVWLVLMIVLSHLFNRLVSRLHLVITDVAAEREDRERLAASFPEILPLLDKLVSMRQDLRRDEQMLRWLIDRTPTGRIVLDKHGCIKQINLAGCKILGFMRAPEAFAGQSYEKLLQVDGILMPDDSPVLKALKLGVVVDQEKVFASGRVLRVDAAPIIDQECGEIIGAGSYFQDITNEENSSIVLRRQAAEHFSKARNLQQLLDAIPLAIVAVDTEKRIIAINRTATMGQPLGDEPDQYFGLPLEERLKHIGLQMEDSYSLRALAGEIYRDVRQDIGGHTHIVNAFPMQDSASGKVIGAVCIHQDKSEEERLHREITRMERLGLVGTMAASVAHEVRNPMTVIQGFIQVLMKKNGQEFREYFQLILDELERANGIINNFLALSRNRTVEMETSNLNSIILQMYPLLQADAVKRGHVVDLKLRDTLPDMRMNSREIKQLLLNLGCNGLDAMTEKGILRIATEYARGKIHLLISDNGCGIPADKLEEMFEPFYSTKDTGTGLGLSVCVSIVERHGGNFRVWSRPGMGSIFIIEFNLEENKKALIDHPEEKSM